MDRLRPPEIAEDETRRAGAGSTAFQDDARSLNFLPTVGDGEGSKCNELIAGGSARRPIAVAILERAESIIKKWYLVFQPS